MKAKNKQIRASELLQCRDVLQCIFDLNPLEIDIFRLLNREGAMSANGIALRTGKDRSTAYRALRHLQACRVVYKRTDNLEQGGYRHIYHAASPENVQKEMDSCLKEWYEMIQTAVKRFPKELKISLEDGDS
jgi:predicted transcriptional regulator